MLAVLLPVTLQAAPAPSVLVETGPARQGSLPDIVEAYGTAAPALDGGMTLSIQHEGRVMAIAVTPGETVRQGERLLDIGESAASASAYQQAVTALALARTQRAHTAQLLTQQLATRDQLAQADKAMSDAETALEALRREGAGQAVHTLSAPFDGIVASIPVAQGDRVQPGSALMALTRLDGLVVTVGIEPGDRASVRSGERVALDRLAGGEKLTGQVLRIDGMLNPKTRQIDADISVPAGSVISGEAFRAAITVGQIKGWLVPHDAVLIDDKGAYVFQVADGKAVRVDVSLAGTSGDTDVVTGPVESNRPIVIQGNYQLEDGTTVREAPNKEAAR